MGVSLLLQKRLAASVLKCGKGKIWLDPNEVNEISMANSRAPAPCGLGVKVVRAVLAHRGRAVGRVAPPEAVTQRSAPFRTEGRTRARASLLCSGARAYGSALTPPLLIPGQNIRKLVKDGFVIKKPEKVHSRARTNAWAEAKRKVGRCQLRHRSSSCHAADHRGRGTGTRHLAAGWCNPDWVRGGRLLVRCRAREGQGGTSSRRTSDEAGMA
jgi:ribosomal protein L19E